MSQYKIPLSEIEAFLHGHDEEKYIVNIEYDRKTNLIYKIKHLPDGTKSVETEPLKAFMWVKNLNAITKKLNFYKNNHLLIAKAREEYGITISPLNHGDNDRLFHGFKYLLTCDQGYDRMFDFFYQGGFKRGLYDETHDIKNHFLILHPVEQYLIATGKRLFKGYEDYDDIEKFVFDLETTGLDPKTSRIFLIGCRSNKGFEELFHCETEGDNADNSEAEAIMKFFAVIDYIKPAIIGGYNSANFDWDFIFNRCEILGLDVKEIAKTLKDDSVIQNKRGVLKLGNEVEDYTQTNMFGYSIIDVIHSVRRAQAIDSNLKSASLKNVCKYNKINKNNRVYIKGDRISSLFHEDKNYFFNERTGVYFEVKPTFERIDFISRDMIQNNPKKIFIFGDNEEKSGLDGEPNTIGVPIKKTQSLDVNSFYSDDQFDENKKKINNAIKQILSKIREGYSVVYPSNDVGFSELSEMAPKTYKFLNASIDAIERYINEEWFEVSGEYIVRRYLMDDLWETMEVDNVYNQSSFMLAKLVPTTYQRISTMGTAALWKMLMLTWSYERGIAVPESDQKREFVGGLSRLLKVGFSKNLRKMDFNSLYPAIQLAHDVFPDVDITGVMKSMLKYFHSERFKAKNLASKYKKAGDYKMESLYKRKQLPLKIFINSMFGALGAPNAFPWAQMDIAEGITCRARQYLRLMVKFFMKKGYTPTVLDTDGVNFMAPESGEDSFYYVGKGFNSEVVDGKEYSGINAVVAEFNDLYMRGEMALGLDGMWPSTINLARKNYALLESDGSISLTGNTIKSKKMPTYIEEFLDKALPLLLNDKGYEFVQYYYEYIEKIYNKQIPLSKIATKARVKKTIKEYKERGVNKNNAALPKQAHMELAIFNDLNINLGDTLYYVNNGTKKSHGDIQTTKKCKLKAAEVRKYVEEHNKQPGPEFFEITEKINCYLLSDKDIEDNPNKLGDYNVEKYVDMFNSRIQGLMVNFNIKVRNEILITKPENKKSWLVSELELVNGQPNEEADQDTIEELFTPSNFEMIFWKKSDYKSDFWFENDVQFTIPGVGETFVI